MAPHDEPEHNDGDYSGRYATLGGTCAGKHLAFAYGIRRVSANDALGDRRLGTTEG